MKNENVSEIELGKAQYYFNREISLLDFNERVLHEAQDLSHPILERLKYVCILSSNLDEFFMIRVAGLKSQIAAGVLDLSYDGKTPQEQLSEIRSRLIPIYKLQEKILMKDILPNMRKQNLFIHKPNELNQKDNLFLEKYFLEKILPVLTPISIDPSHPFPRVINRLLHIIFTLKNDSGKNANKKIVILQVPPILSRFIPIERPNGYHFVLTEQVIKDFANILFPGMEIESANTFRITRDADFEIAEDEAEDLLSEIEEQIKLRRWGKAAVRLEVSDNMPKFVMEYLRDFLQLSDDDVYIHNRPLHLIDFMSLLKLDVYELKDKTFTARTLPEFMGDDVDMFSVISKKDVFLHHPFDSFSNSTLKFITQAAADKNVLAIKITLYRTGENSTLINALKKAAELGKSVTAFVELKARFDEANNIIWARELEQAGVHVIYGVLGLKTHCKITMVVRNENAKLKTYLHLSTGNYNQSTARLYTDTSIFTANDSFGKDAVHLFNYLTGYSKFSDWKAFIVAPINLFQKVIELIDREAELHTPENPGEIFVKMNSLAQKDVIMALYRASQKGVKIKMLVRGVCSLKPGIEGLSENIEVRSVLGRFLEHSRIFKFKNAGNCEYYMASADWMSRNLLRRVELMFPINSKSIQRKIDKILTTYWEDNTKSWVLTNSGKYEKLQANDGEEFNAQEYFLTTSKRLRAAGK